MGNAELRLSHVGDVILFALPAAAVIGFVLPLILGYWSLSILAVYLAVPMFFGPILYKAFCRTPCMPSRTNRRYFLLLFSVFSLLFSISVFLLLFNPIRPISYYVVITLMATMVMLEIELSAPSNRQLTLILMQIVILSLDVIWGVALKYYYFIGRTDIFAHVSLIESVVDSGKVTDVFGIYEPFPLWHIEIASTHAVIGGSVSVSHLAFFTNGLVFSFLLVLVFLVALKVLRNPKLALLSSLFVSLNPDFIYYGMSSISRSVESFFIVMLILLLLSGKDTKKLALAILLIPAMIAYHTASMPFIILIFAAMMVAQRLLGFKSTGRLPSAGFLVAMVTMTLVYWVFNAEILFESLVGSVFEPPQTGALTPSILEAPLNEVFNYLQYSPLLLLIIVGVLWVSSSRGTPDLGKLFCLFGLIFVSISFPGPGLLSNKLAGNFNLARFGEYTLIFISMAAAVGFAWTLGKARKRTSTMILAASLFASVAFMSVSNDFTASDNPIVERSFYTFYLREDEVIALETVPMLTDGYVMSDYVATRYLMSSPMDSKSHLLEVNDDGTDFLRNSTKDIILIRGQELDNRPLRFYSSSFDEFVLRPGWGNSLDYYYSDSPLWNSLEDYNRVIDYGGVLVYV